MTDKTPVKATIPTELAWIENGRIHINCGYGSTLSDFLRSGKIKRQWHPETKTWSVDRNNEKIIPRLEAHAAGQAASQAIKTGETEDLYFFTIEYKYSSTRAAAKKRGCRWDAEREAWYTGSESVHAEMLDMGGVSTV